MCRADSIEAVALGPPGAKRQHRVEAIESLNRGLLIDTEHRGVLRRIDVEPDHIGGLALEVWIIRGHVALQPMGLKPGAPPDPRDHHMIDPQRPRQLAAAPVGGAIIGRVPGPGQNAGFQPRSALTHRPPLMAGKQTCQTLLRKAGLPTSDVSRAAAQGLLDGGPRLTFGQHQDQPRAAHVTGAQHPRAHSRTKFLSLGPRQSEGCSKHAD